VGTLSPQLTAKSALYRNGQLVIFGRRSWFLQSGCVREPRNFFGTYPGFEGTNLKVAKGESLAALATLPKREEDQRF
jgi:hypothetical protein